MPCCCEEGDKSEAAPGGGRARYDASFMSAPPAWVEPAAAPLKPPPSDKKAGTPLGSSMKSGSAGKGGSAAGLELRAAPRMPMADDLPEVSTLSRAQMNWAIARCARGALCALLCVRCFFGGAAAHGACVWHAAAARAPRRAVPRAAGATGLACGGAAPRPARRAHARGRAAGWRALAPWWHLCRGTLKKGGICAPAR